MESRLHPSELIQEAQGFFELGGQIQGDSSLDDAKRQGKLQELSGLYRDWYRRALGVFVGYGRLDLQKEFMWEFEGSFLSQKIKRFLEAGWKPYELYKPRSVFPKWTVTYDRSFEGPLERQLDLLAALTAG